MVLYLGHKLVYRHPFVKAADADLYTGRKEIDEMVVEEHVPMTIWGKFWAWLG